MATEGRLLGGLGVLLVRLYILIFETQVILRHRCLLIRAAKGSWLEASLQSWLLLGHGQVEHILLLLLMLLIELILSVLFLSHAMSA